PLQASTVPMGEVDIAARTYWHMKSDMLWALPTRLRHITRSCIRAALAFPTWRPASTTGGARIYAFVFGTIHHAEVSFYVANHYLPNGPSGGTCWPGRCH